MHNVKHLITNLLLAAWLLAFSGSASAAPIYHVNIDTSSLGSGEAYLGLSFLSLAGGEGASATVSNLAGALVGAALPTGSVSGALPGSFVFSSAGGGGDLLQVISLGGMFSFDVIFTMAAGDVGSTFSWALFDATQYLGLDGDLGSIFLQPGAQVTFSPANQFSRVNTIPEPSTVLLLLLAGCGMIVATRRSRPR